MTVIFFFENAVFGVFSSMSQPPYQQRIFNNFCLLLHKNIYSKFKILYTTLTTKFFWRARLLNVRFFRSNVHFVVLQHDNIKFLINQVHLSFSLYNVIIKTSTHHRDWKGLYAVIEDIKGFVKYLWCYNYHFSRTRGIVRMRRFYGNCLYWNPFSQR